MSTAFIFPGQGSQAIGMAQALAQAFPVAREVLQEVDEALGQSLSTLMFEGPLDALTLTQMRSLPLWLHRLRRSG
jgi:[acyl-carrier-protein] S-malonyltransferase